MWHITHDNFVSPLVINDDRIVAIQVQLVKDSFMYIFQIYLACSNHSIQKYKEYIEKLDDLWRVYSELGDVIIMGDFNCSIDKKESNSLSGRQKEMLRFIKGNNCVSINAQSDCMGAKSSFVSYGNKHESLNRPYRDIRG